MNITQENAIAVAMILSTLLDERFTMRTLAGIRKAAGNPEALTDQVIGNAAAEMGMKIRRRIRDDAMLIERPLPVEELRTLCAKVQLVAAGTEQPFEIDFAPVELPESLPANDVLGDIEGNLGRTHGNGDEDEQFGG